MADKKSMKKYIKAFLFTTCVITLNSCSGVMVKNVNHKPKFAPTNYQPIGAIEYSNNGSESDREEVREEAFEEMHKACYGNYEVIREGRKAEFMHISYFERDYRYIEFRCLEKTAAK